jgi:hypothetical protein
VEDLFYSAVVALAKLLVELELTHVDSEGSAI